MLPPRKSAINRFLKMQSIQIVCSLMDKNTIKVALLGPMRQLVGVENQVVPHGIPVGLRLGSLYHLHSLNIPRSTKAKVELDVADRVVMRAAVVVVLAAGG